MSESMQRTGDISVFIKLECVKLNNLKRRVSVAVSAFVSLMFVRVQFVFRLREK